MSLSVAIVGRGRVGRGLRAALHDVAPVTLLASGRPRQTDADVLVFAVPDASIASVAHAWLPKTRADAVFLHCAGSLGIEAFGGLHDRELGTLHPLISFADPKHPPDVEGATFALTGSPTAMRLARRVVRACRGRALDTEGLVGPAYHAAAALVANGAAALATLGVQILERLGVDRRGAEHAVGALLRSVAQNVISVGVPEALTGPIARGDAETVARHRRALRRDERAAYDALGPSILRVARRAGLSPARARAVADQLRKRK